MSNVTTTPEIVTIDNLRTITRTRSLGYGISLIVLGAIEVLWFGSTPSSIHTQIQLAYNSATSVPELSSWLRVLVLVVGVLVLPLAFGPSVFSPLPRLPRAARIVAAIVGVLFVAWPISLWLGINQDGQIRDFLVSVSVTGYLFGAISAVVGAIVVWRRFDRLASPLLYAGIVLFILAFLIWVARITPIDNLPLPLTGILWGAIQWSPFLALGALAGTMSERSGVVNIAIEGQFIAGALVSTLVASAMNGTGISLWLALLLAGSIGMVFSWVLALMANRYRANQIIVGILLVSFATAVSQFISNAVLDVHQNLNQTLTLPTWNVPVLSRIPVVGPVLFAQNIIVYITIGMAVFTNVLLFRTRWGLRTRSVGEKPIASETVGINVFRMRYAATILGGFLAGLGGAALTLGKDTQFAFGMSNNFGYVALAIMIFGRWRPYGALVASLLFGFTASLGAQVSIWSGQTHIPGAFIDALPYAVTILVVSGLVGRIRPPAADGLPFVRR